MEKRVISLLMIALLISISEASAATQESQLTVPSGVPLEATFAIEQKAGNEMAARTAFINSGATAIDVILRHEIYNSRNERIYVKSQREKIPTGHTTIKTFYEFDAPSGEYRAELLIKNDRFSANASLPLTISPISSPTKMQMIIISLAIVICALALFAIYNKRKNKISHTRYI